MSGWRWVWVAGALEVVGWLKVGFLERRRVQGGMGWVVVEGGWVAVVGWGWGCDWELGLVLGMGWVVGISAGVRGGGRISVHGHRATLFHGRAAPCNLMSGRSNICRRVLKRGRDAEESTQEDEGIPRPLKTWPHMWKGSNLSTRNKSSKRK